MTDNLPWWKRLDEHYANTPNHTHIDQLHPFKVRGTAAVDIALRTVLASMSLVAMAPRLLRPERMREDLEQLVFYTELADRADASAVFVEPPREVAIKVNKIPTLTYRPAGIPCRQLSFSSPFQALNPALRESYASHHRNRQVVAQHWTHPSGPRPTLIFTHGVVADSYAFNSLMFSLSWFYRKGYDIVLYTLPFHGPRQGQNSLFSGFGYMAHGLAHMNEVMLQSVYDLRILMSYLEDSGVPAMGLTGLSLGGYVTALTTCADARPAFAIPNAPAVLPMDILLDTPPTSLVMRHMLRRQELSVAGLRHLTAVHCPLTYPTRLPPERLMVIGGAGDRFTPPRHVKLLQEHWAGSQMHWFPGNHVMHLQQGEYLKLMLRFMNEVCASA